MGLSRVGATFVALLVATGMATGCGSSSTDTADTDATVTISHKFGETKVPENPARVVTVGWNDQDFVLALGIVPVVSRAWFDNYDNYPWVQEATGGKGVPTLSGEGIQYEDIAAAKPDVIFAIYETIDRPTYDRLSQIAPTVIQSGDYPDEETPWNEQLLRTGKALGKDAEAQALADQVNARIDEARAANPGFAGKVLVEDFGPENGGHYLIGEGDPRRALFDALGFAAQDTTGDVSEENVSLLDRDVLFVNGATEEQMTASPVFARLNVVKEDRTLYTTFDSNLSGALSYSGPKALLYALDQLVPQLSNAVNGRPIADLSHA
ncbi:ABC transporter substrate-binding protein [Pseudonocardia adelaidensis]|uniref:Iron-siderophore ABC transporter substrate-binding protein n=1 Tax=Pseudonocardia adelaidensis TaxID=648754 RepID=A0ABP9NZM2_9PSEU